MKNIKYIVFAIILFCLFIVPIYAKGEVEQGEIIAPVIIEPHAVEKSFIKKDSEGNLINNAKFIQKTLDNKLLKEISCEYYKEEAKADKDGKSATAEDVNNNAGNYKYIVGYINSTNQLYDLLTSEQKEIMGSISTLQDYNKIKDYISAAVIDKAYCNGKEEYVKALKNSKGITANINYYYDETLQQETTTIDNIVFEFTTFTIIEETYTPFGFEKEIMVSPIKVSLVYHLEADDTLTLNGGKYSPFSKRFSLLKYNPNINYNKVSDFYDKMSEEYIYPSECSDNPKWFSYMCKTGDNKKTIMMNESPNEDSGGISAEPDAYVGMCPTISIITDNKTSEDLSKKIDIKTFVNDKERVRVKKNSEVTITVKVKNDSKSPMYNNTIVSNIPSDLEYVSDSLSDNGVYDNDKKTITWSIEYLDSMNEGVYSYKLKVPSNADTTILYKTNASISNDQFEIPVISDNAEVDLGIKEANPNTGDVRELVLLIIFALGIGTLLLSINKKSIQSI